jgi:hypothetical protein
MIVFIHEAGHAEFLLKDPANVNLENMARAQLGVPLRDDYQGMPIPPLPERNQQVFDRLIERDMQRMKEEMDREDQRRRDEEGRQMQEAEQAMRDMEQQMTGN